MIYAYIRVSTDDQTVKNQQDMIERAGYRVDKWLADEGVSGTVDWTKREINVAVEQANEGDSIIVAELSRLGRSLKQILEIVELCQKKKVNIIMIREGIQTNNDSPVNKLLLSILGSLAEMERNLISQRTKDALALKRKNGVVLGRPVGKNTPIEKMKLYPKREQIMQWRNDGISYAEIARRLKVNRITVSKFINTYQGAKNNAYNRVYTSDQSSE
ncbi:recombinase family protein [Enterococcus cecorum]|uniref:recombinase family protein n=1 Tax=Enterococcus cecorum TaxID=44008 RepID=UPI00148CA43C|nr:recombinase family protein [Enterococcus cecorum]MDZ5577794.1 recombinase family protein [Enterococcus cecorum]